MFDGTGGHKGKVGLMALEAIGHRGTMGSRAPEFLFDNVFIAASSGCKKCPAC